MHCPDDSAETMVRLACVAFVAVLGLAAVSSAAARPAGGVSYRVPDSESFELRRGVGYAALWDRGSVLGRVVRGRVRVTNLAGGGAPSGWVRGCEHRSGRLVGTVICLGSNLRFWIHGGTWKIQLRGRGINVSGVVRGTLALDRRLPPAGRGIFAVGSGDFRRWPEELTFYRLHG